MWQEGEYGTGAIDHGGQHARACVCGGGGGGGGYGQPIMIAPSTPCGSNNSRRQSTREVRRQDTTPSWKYPATYDFVLRVSVRGGGGGGGQRWCGRPRGLIRIAGGPRSAFLLLFRFPFQLGASRGCGEQYSTGRERIVRAITAKAEYTPSYVPQTRLCPAPDLVCAGARIRCGVSFRRCEQCRKLRSKASHGAAD